MEKITVKNYRIIFTVSNDLRQDQRMHKICKSLSEFGFDVILVGKRHASSPSFDIPSIHYRRILCFNKTGFFFYFEYNFRLFFFLLFRNFDAVCSIDLDTIVPVAISTSLKNKLHIHDAHEFFEESMEIIKRPRIKLFWDWIGKKFIPLANHHYTVNQSLASLFEKKYSRKFEVILNVPERTTHLNQTFRNPEIILYQGMLNEGRGLEMLIELARDLPIKLWIVGEGKLSTKLAALAQEFNVSHKVTFWGFKTGESLKETTLKADIGVNILDPSSANYRFSLANRTFDFIQAGLPAIHMDFLEYRLINEEYCIGELVLEYSTDSIKRALLKFLDDPEYYQKIRQNCLKASTQFHWENEKNKLQLLYKDWTKT